MHACYVVCIYIHICTCVLLASHRWNELCLNFGWWVAGIETKLYSIDTLFSDFNKRSTI